jgi:hypothetical protein
MTPSTLLRPIACAAWAALAIASATPADALAQTVQTGTYATCRTEYSNEVLDNCNGSFPYCTAIKFINLGCASGACDAIAFEDTFVESLYGPGRKIATAYSSCNSLHLYGLGSCSC